MMLRSTAEKRYEDSKNVNYKKYQEIFLFTKNERMWMGGEGEMKKLSHFLDLCRFSELHNSDEIDDKNVSVD